MTEDNVPAEGLERYGLVNNPFRELSAEATADIPLFHVNLEMDGTLQSIKDEVLEKSNRAVVALAGPIGTGKTERLLLAQSEAKERKAFVIYFDITLKNSWVFKGIGKAVQDQVHLGGFAKALAPPHWYRDIQALQKIKDQNYDPRQVGKSLASALNENAPAFLLLNDAHVLEKSPELDAFVIALQEIADGIHPGVLVMFSCYPDTLSKIFSTHPAFASRVNTVFNLPRLTAEEAGLLLAKKMLAKRVVEDLDPLFPFDMESIAALNALARGNPRKLLHLADQVVELGVSRRAYRIDTELVEAIKTAPPPKTPSSQPSK
jgi:replication-associated recombination protein RarA